MSDSENSYNNHSNETSENQVLTENLITKNLSNLGRTADGTKFAYLNLSLRGCNLEDVNALTKFKELQSIDLSFNCIKDLSALGELPFLLEISVSNNKIEKLFDFLPPYNLKEANFSFNHIKEIGNLSNFHYLQTLELNNNRIEKIEGLEYCQRLKSLNLAHNMIKKIEGLDNLPLINLDLRSNQLKKIEGLNSLKCLRFLNLSNNMIKSLNGIPEKHEFLENIDLENNKISSLSEIENLVSLNLLRDLNLLNNPIRELEDYRLAVIFKIQKLTILDRRKIDPVEKVKSKNVFYPSPEYISSRDHMTNFIFNFIQDHKVKESTLPNIDSPYPILLLCGPEGSGCSDMARKISKEYSEYFDYVVPFTTKKPKSNEIDKVNFNFIKMQEFENDVTQGKFICCNEYLGDWYGIQWESIEAVAKQGLACVINMELESLLSFKQTYFEPRCVLILTLDKQIHQQRLSNQGLNEVECEMAVNRTEWYADYNRDHPGFFDAVISTDDINQGYENLKNLVLSYLGVSNDDQKEALNQQNIHIQRQLSMLQSSRGKTMDDLKRLEEQIDLQRTDSFLPSNTTTANRSQLSHISMESLSHIYNQNLRLKFGSAPPQLLTKGEHAEKSLEKRTSAIKQQFEFNNMVNNKSQINQHLQSKQAMQGTISSNSWYKSKSLSRNDEEKKKSSQENSSSEDDNDDVLIPINKKSNKPRNVSALSSSSSKSLSSSLSSRN